ncbi:hypothetical protein ABN089_03750 [Proteus terrae]|uniref:hypothetical protein n=1 Tax=Proteus terrae TaxID=1574161 RepID=UPI0032DA3B7A
MDILDETFEVWFKKSHGYSPSVAPPDSYLIGVRRMAFKAGYRAALIERKDILIGDEAEIKNE